MGDWLAVDFGTSNSAAAFLQDGRVQRIHLEKRSETIPSTVFFSFDRQEVLVGRAANDALIDGQDGRYMRSLKRVLGTSLMGERRTIIGLNLDFYDIISNFLKTIRERAEAQTGRVFDKVVAGRPVHFDGRDGGNGASGADLQRCYEMAGFRQIVFVPEPEAAAFAVDDRLAAGEVGLVVDIGGGTSDFSVFRKGGRSIDILGSHGVQIGGTDFDRALNLKFIMPCLGYGQPIRTVMTQRIIPAPNRLFLELATWEQIPFVYTRRTRSLVQELVRDAVTPTLFKRLLHVVDARLGHEMAFMAEKAKIDSNASEEATRLELSLLERGLTTQLHGAALAEAFQPLAEVLIAALLETLARAGMDGAPSHVVPVGGASLMRPVKAAIAQVAPAAELVDAPIFTAIVDGLARFSSRLETGDRAQAPA